MKLVYVEWVDSSTTSGWRGLENVRGWPDAEVNHACYSVGWLVRKGRQMLMLAPHINATVTSGCDFMEIPVCAVRKIKEIRGFKRGK